MFPGLVLVLSSLRARMQEGRRCNIYLFQQGFSSQQISELQAICADPSCCLIVRGISVEQFQQFPSFNGNYLNYGRLLLPELLVHENKVVYLDCDLLVNLDIATLFDQMMDRLPLAGVPYGRMDSMDDWELMQKHGLPPEADYINNGVLLLDLEMWRRENLMAASMEFMQTNRTDLLRHEQSLMNCLFFGRIKMLPERFNQVAIPDVPLPELPSEGIIHFVGTPKPWEPGARTLNKQHPIFVEGCQQLGLKLPVGSYKQILKDPRSYARLSLRILGLHSIWKRLEQAISLVRRSS